MTIGKRHLVCVTVHIEAITNMEDYTLGRRMETFIDPNRLRSESLEEREYIRFTNTKIDIHPAGAPQTTMQLPIPPLVEPASDGMKLQAIKGILEEIKGVYTHPDQLETVVFQAVERIAKLVG
jgi:hypothetical protein